MLHSLDDYPHIKNNHDHLILSTDIDNQRILQLSWMRVKTDLTQPKKGSPTCYLSLMIISMQKIQEITESLPDILMIKESWNLIGQETNLA